MADRSSYDEEEGYAMRDSDCNEIFLEEVTKSVREDAVVVDIGCGNNKCLDLVSKRIGIGVDEELYPGVQNTNFVLGDVEKIPLKDECSDIVIGHCVLEHLENPTDTAQEIYRILRDSGVFIFVTPHRYHLASFAASIVPWNSVKRWLIGYRVYTTYYRCNTISLIRKTLYSVGFQEVKLVKTYEPTWAKYNILNVFLQPVNRIYKSKIRSFFPPIISWGCLSKRKAYQDNENRCIDSIDRRVAKGI